MLIYLLDLVGVFAFAFFGAHAGLKQNFNVLGIITCAFLPALGGGTIREVLLNHSPVYFTNHSYGLAVLLAAIFAISTRRNIFVKRYMYLLDALGMAIFAYLGAYAAAKADLGIGGSVTFALLTACGGGIICDIITRQVPHAFNHRWYALPPVVFGALYWCLGGLFAPVYITAALIGMTFLLQLAIILGKIVPFYSNRLRPIFSWTKNARSMLLSYKKP